PDQLDAGAERDRAQEARLRAALAGNGQRLAGAVARCQELEQQHADAERALRMAVKAIAYKRAGLARLTGEVNAARSRMAASDEEIERQAAALAEARERAEIAEVELAEAQAVEADL